MQPILIPLPEKIARLRQTLLFGELALDDIRELAEAAEGVSVGAGEEVVRQGDAGDALFIVTRGLLRAKGHKEKLETTLGDINKGAFFGEFALLEESVRSASVVAVTATQLLRLNRDAWKTLSQRAPELDSRLRMTLERRRQENHSLAPPSATSLTSEIRNIFPQLPPDVLESIRDAIEWVWLPMGETLLHQGDPGDAMYFVLSGRLLIFVQDGTNHPIHIGEAGAGDSVGEIALLSGAPRMASAKASLDTALLRLSPQAFDQILQSAPEAMDHFRNLVLARIVSGIQDNNSASSRMIDAVTPEDVENVLRTEDFVLRNFKITQSYHRLAMEIRNLLGDDDINWLAFGAHASNTAGYAIRQEEIPLRGIYEGLHRNAKIGRLAKLLSRLVTGSFVVRYANRVQERMADAISDGNLRIFADMAPVIVRFLELVRHDSMFDKAKIDAFRRTLKGGEAREDGQEMLGLALAAWYEAAHETDPRRRSQLVLLGNARMGWHEQVRVQPDIEEALGAPLWTRVGDELSLFLQRRLSALPKPFRISLLRIVKVIEPTLLNAASLAIKQGVTRNLMRYRMPNEEIRLGRNLVPQKGKALYPAHLETIDHPELKALLASFGTKENDGKGRGASDWAVFEERMEFIVALFRSRQNDSSLFETPLPPDSKGSLALAAEATSTKTKASA